MAGTVQTGWEQPRSEPAALRPRQVWLPYVHALIGCLILSWFVVYNGWPVFYEDTSGYLTRPGRVLGSLGLATEWNPLAPGLVGDPTGVPEATSGNFRSAKDNPVWMGGRSVYYGTLMVLISALATTYAIALVQAYLTALAIAIPWFRLGGKPVSYLALLALLSLVTGVAVVASALIPDIFFAVAVLACATLLVLWRELTLLDRWVLTLLLCFSALSHQSILALLLLISAASGLAMLVRAGRAAYLRFTPIWFASVVGVCGLLAFALLAQIVSGRPPLNLPHLAARTATTAAGKAVLEERCPEIKLAVCDYRSQIARGDWITFMFSKDTTTGVFGPAPLSTKYRLSQEQFSLVLLVAKERPLAFAQAEAQDMIRELASFTLIDFDVSKKRGLVAIVSPDMLARIQATRSFRDGGRVLSALSDLTYVSTVVGLVCILVYFAFKQDRLVLTQSEIFAFLLLVGVLINALICGALAGVYDRFQARVIWLVPLAAAFIILNNTRRYGSKDQAHTGDEHSGGLS